MSLSIGIIGLPNVGKSTLFNALLKRQVALAANYPFATIEPNVGVVDVPDDRLQKLSQLVKDEFGHKFTNREIPEKVVPATVKFYDIAGLVKGAHKGEGLGNQFLGHIRSVDVIVHVVRAFDDENVIRAGSTAPEEDMKIINTELALADIQVVDGKLARLESELRKGKTKELVALYDICKKLQEIFNQPEPNALAVLSEDDIAIVQSLNLLSLKPVLLVFNVDEGALRSVKNSSNDRIYLCAKVESELSSLDASDQVLYLQDLGIFESGLDLVIKRCYSMLNLHTFLTAGPKEVRAWTIRKGAKAPEAAGVIHSDFEKGFIAADVIDYASLVATGGWKKARESGLIRLEGKNYIMNDGDVVEFRFNV